MRNISFTLIICLVALLSGISSCNSGKLKETGASETGVREDAGASVSDAELTGNLLDAALQGDLEGVRKAMESGANVNGTDAEGHSPLMFAAFNGHTEIVLMLLDAGAGIDRRDVMGRTSLLYAATGPFPETVKTLLDRGATVNVVDSDEHFSPLMHAAAEGNLDVVKILLGAGADPALKDVDGDDAAFFARQAGHIEVANYLDAL